MSSLLVHTDLLVNLHTFYFLSLNVLSQSRVVFVISHSNVNYRTPLYCTCLWIMAAKFFPYPHFWVREFSAEILLIIKAL